LNAASKQDKVSVPCPHCGQLQTVPRAAVSTVCKNCTHHFLVQDLLKPSRGKGRSAEIAPELRIIQCFDCATELKVAPNAESTMCKRCSTHIDLRNYHIANAVSKNFRTKGDFVVEPKGYVFNTEATVGDAVIKGRFLGKLVAERSLTIYSSAEIKGTFTASVLIIPAKTIFHWKEPIKIGSAEIAGELSADLLAAKGVLIKPTGLLFGKTEAKQVVVEAGGVLVGDLRIG